MLTIRQNQFQELDRAWVRSLAPELVGHARANHAEHAAALGEPGLSQFVDRVIDAAIAYDLRGLRTLSRLLDLTVVLGLPLPPAEHKTMLEKTNGGPKDRLERVWKRTLFRLEATK